MKEVLKHFQIEGAIEKVALFGSGHINDTYHVATSRQHYLLQKINTTVFSRVDVLENNLSELFKLKTEILVEHIPSVTGSWLWSDDTGVWKVQVFDQEAYAPQLADSTGLVSAVGKGFGRFTALNDNLSVDNFQEVIPDFQDLNWRLKQLDEATANNKAKRLEKAKALVDQADSFRWVASKMNELRQNGLPLRLCHNDTKIDNILLEKGTDRFKYVIDLDTAGPGYVLNDFGDMMRTLLSPTRESEPDMSKISLRLDYFEALQQGFLSECAFMLEPVEKQSLAFGGYCMTYITAIRFLADYLNGDVYYRVSHPEENYIRSRNQFALLQLMHEHKLAGERIVS